VATSTCALIFQRNPSPPHYDNHRAYFVDVLASFLASPKFTRHELNEYVLPAVHSESSAATQSAPIHALELAHALAFRSGLGHSLYADAHATGNITAEDVRDLHARAVGNPRGVAVLGTGITTDSLAKLLESAYSAHNKKASSSVVPPETMPRLPRRLTTAALPASRRPTPTSALRRLRQHCLHHRVRTRATRPRRAPELCAFTQVGYQCRATRVGDPRRRLRAQRPPPLLGRYAHRRRAQGGTDASALKEAAKAVVAAFRDAAAGKVGKEELARATARAKFQLRRASKGVRDTSAFGPKVLRGEKASVQKALEGVQAVSGTSLSQVRVLSLPVP
jgi:ubiquinol-cytochrome c reductase core subunit 2